MFVWDDFQEMYMKLYDRFEVNRMYRERSFKNAEEYVDAQKKLAAEIEELDGKVAEKLKKLVNEGWPDAEMIAYDSRMQSFQRNVLGRILLKGLSASSQCLEVAAWIEKKTTHKVAVDRYEDLADDVKESLGEGER